MNIIENKYILPVTAWTLFVTSGVVFLIGSNASRSDYQYLPSAEWISRSPPYAFASGILFMFLLWTLFLDAEAVGRGPRRLLVAFGGYLIAFMFGGITIFEGPILLALLAGEKTELSYTVEAVKPIYLRRKWPFQNSCAFDVVLTRQVFGAASFCVPADAPETKMKAGTRIIIAGNGTSYGVFLSDVKILK